MTEETNDVLNAPATEEVADTSVTQGEGVDGSSTEDKQEEEKEEA